MSEMVAFFRDAGGSHVGSMVGMRKNGKIKNEANGSTRAEIALAICCNAIVCPNRFC